MSNRKLEPFIRYAEKTDYLPNRDFVLAYDCRLFYCLSGQGTLRFEDAAYQLVPGTLCLYPSGIRYLPLSAAEEPMQFVILNFDYTCGHSEQVNTFEPVHPELFDPSRLIPSWGETGEPNFEKPQILPDFQNVENELLEIVREWKMKQLHYREVASSLLTPVLYRVLRRLAVSTQGGQRVEEVLDFIHTHYAQHLDYGLMAQRFHYHPYYLNALIKARTGQSLHRYLLGYRIREACHLLVSTDDLVGEIARAVGFENKDHFSASFKKIIGLSPLQYRKEHNL